MIFDPLLFERIRAVSENILLQAGARQKLRIERIRVFARQGAAV